MADVDSFPIAAERGDDECNDVASITLTRTEIGGNVSDICAYRFCCVASACKKDNVPFDMSLMDFADSITPDDLNQWTEVVNGTTEQSPESDAEGEKKS